jgi:hypothetical protein
MARRQARERKIAFGAGHTLLPGGKHAEPEISTIEPEGSDAARPQDPEARGQQLDKGPDPK